LQVVDVAFKRSPFGAIARDPTYEIQSGIAQLRARIDQKLIVLNDMKPTHREQTETVGPGFERRNWTGFHGIYAEALD